MNRFVHKLSTMGNLNQADTDALTRTTQTFQSINPKTDLIREGDHAGAMIVILEGWACRYKLLPNGSRQIMAFLMAGDACDLNIWRLSEMDHSIQTLTHAQVAKVDRQVVDELIAKHPSIAHALYRSQLVDEGTLRAWIVSLGRRNSVERLSHLLLELYFRCVRVGLAEDEQMEFPFSQVVVADALGMTAVHINRVFQELRRAGAIELSRGLLRLINVKSLVEIAGFDGNYLHRRVSQATGSKIS